MNATSNALILNVDDNDGARYAKSRILRGAGFTVEEAANGTDALAFVRDHAPALVVLDVKLPDINGIEVCRLIKNDPATVAVLVLQTSAALTGIADKIRGLEGGADNYLAAPIEADELIANVNALLRLQRVQKDLRNSEERFRELAENIDDVFWISAVGEKGFLYVSPAYSTLWGRKHDELAHNPDDWFEGVHPEDYENVYSHFRSAAGQTYFDLEYRLQLPDGRVRWVHDRTYPVKNSREQIYRIARITSDVSSRKEAERLLQEADLRKNEFLATLAHELRNPLGPIRNGINLLERLGEGNQEVRNRTRQIISRQVDHLSHLVDDLLDIARIAQGKIALRKDQIELAAIINAGVETASAFIAERGHVLNVHLPAQQVWLTGDAVRLAQSIDNLLHNAAKFTEKGGNIELHAKVLDDDTLEIRVTDNGIGIAPTDIDHIFGLFSQGDIPSDRAQDGLGIGLSLVKRLIEMHGGRISVSSPGLSHGSTFTISLPLSALKVATTPVAAPVETTSVAANAGRKVLLVDDNVDSIGVMQMLLDDMGFETYAASDPDTAIELAKQHLPAVVLLDIGLPGKDGYEVARILRQQSGLENVKLIALSGYGLEEDKQKSRDAGFDQHLVKPADFNSLIKALSS